MKKFLWFLLILLFLGGGIYFFREPILRSMGRALIVDQDPDTVQVAFVLAGGPYTRAMQAAKLYRWRSTPLLVCTGITVREDYKAMKIDLPEAEVTRRALVAFGVQDSDIEKYLVGTSTYEEAEFIREYCGAHKIKKAMIVSSAFHTRRVRFIFRKVFKGADTELNIQSSPSADYKEDEWWRDENGLIALNNEYVKMLYYWWKY